MPTTLLDAAEAVVTLLKALPEWPDNLELEAVRRRKVAKNEVDVAIWRERRELVQEALGEDAASSLYRHSATLRVVVHVTGDETTSRAKIDAMLAQAGLALDLDRTLGGLVSDLTAGETSFDWDEGAGAGQAFHQAEFTLAFDYDSNNPLI